jgi:ABC-type Zn uptake system ZnuABC Zn-binding protein ZnuA
MSRETFEANLNRAVELADKLHEEIKKVFPTAPRSSQEQSDFEKRMEATKQRVLKGEV